MAGLLSSELWSLAPLAIFFLVALLRLSGKRTLSKMNAFDFVVTVAFGSTLAAMLYRTRWAMTHFS